MGEATCPAGTLLAARFDAFLAGARELVALFQPEVPADQHSRIVATDPDHGDGYLLDSEGFLQADATGGPTLLTGYGGYEVPLTPGHSGVIGRGYSPYHDVRAGAAYPPVLFVTSTRDDRVHPAHPRTMAARLREHGHDVAYHENIEGGHGAAANNEQWAFVRALTLEFLWRTLAEFAPRSRTDN